MILSVTFEKTTFNVPPYKFEAGTPAVGQAIGLGAAVDYVSAVGMDRIEGYESELVAYATDQVSQRPGVHLVGTARNRAGLVSFVIDDIHPHDIGTILDRDGIAV